MSDVYCSPEQYGLTPVAEIDFDYDDYGFHMIVVWRHESGKFYVGEDSGCSCPSPFEDYYSLDKLDVLDYEQLKRLVSEYDAPAEMRADFLRKVRDALRKG